jgi:phosphatidylserine/phosphatidylglycerophosphate/cardiolipin synthase-like enzyme
VRKIILSLAVFAMFSQSSHAQFGVAGFELVHTVPVETNLQTPDLRDPMTVWAGMFNAAQHTIDIAQFYVAGKDGDQFDTIIDALKNAGQRGVKIRFLLEEKGKAASEQATVEKLKAIPNLDLRYISFGQLTGGIIHAKYFVVDGAEAFVGSQNFDWRALSHIHETGLRITDQQVVSQVQAIFAQDWQAQAQLSRGEAVPVLNAQTVVTPKAGRSAYLVASPNAYNPPGIGDSETELVHLLSQAKQEIRVQVMDYAPLSYGPNRTRPYYAVIDNALRAAAARGVKVKLMVSNWNTDKPAIDYLKSLAMLPNVEIKIVTIPQASTGFIPYARVTHTKAMAIDGNIAWVGTSNWAGGYLDNSRNLEIVFHDPVMAARITALHQQTWDSSYAQDIDVNKEYPRPAKSAPAK